MPASIAAQPGPPRQPWEARRRDRLLAAIDLASGPGMEFGPLTSPLVRKSEGDVIYIDHATRDELISKYADDPAVDTTRIVDVDVVRDDRPLKDCLPCSRTYAYVIASHVIEHVPDFVGWLREVADVLRPGGCVALAIPDKRYCFDRFRTLTSLADLVDAYLGGNRKPSPRQVFDQAAYFTRLDALTAWMVPALPSKPPHPPDLGEAFERARIASSTSRYVDVHCWVFTPASLLELMAALAELGLLPFRCTSFHDTQPFENEMVLLLEKIDLSSADAQASARQSFADHLAVLSSNERIAPAPDSQFVPRGKRRSLQARLRSRIGLGRLGRLLGLPAPQLPSPAPAFIAGARLRPTSAALPPPELLGRVFPPYYPLFASPATYVSDGQAALASLPDEGGLIKTEPAGYLRHADALLLYELGWYAAGDVLELGSAWGLSTTILCRAVRDAGRGASVTSIEISPEFQSATIRAVEALVAGAHLDARPGAANPVMDGLQAEQRTFSVAFVDHDHHRASVAGACRRLKPLLRSGGIAVFHDFNDGRNFSEPEEYGVYDAVLEILRKPGWRYLGVLGCCGIIQKVT